MRRAFSDAKMTGINAILFSIVLASKLFYYAVSGYGCVMQVSLGKYHFAQISSFIEIYPN